MNIANKMIRGSIAKNVPKVLRSTDKPKIGDYFQAHEELFVEVLHDKPLQQFILRKTPMFRKIGR